MSFLIYRHHIRRHQGKRWSRLERLFKHQIVGIWKYQKIPALYWQLQCTNESLGSRICLQEIKVFGKSILQSTRSVSVFSGVARIPFGLLRLFLHGICCDDIRAWGKIITETSRHSRKFIKQLNKTVFLSLFFFAQMVPVFANSEVVQKFNETTIGKAIVWILLKFYTVVGMGFCLAPLGLLTFDRWWAVYKATWMYGFILWFPWPIYKPILKTLLSSKRKPTTDEKPKSQ